MKHRLTLHRDGSVSYNGRNFTHEDARDPDSDPVTLLLAMEQRSAARLAREWLEDAARADFRRLRR
jgi:hypothetical protein